MFEFKDFVQMVSLNVKHHIKCHSKIYAKDCQFIYSIPLLYDG